ncbi:MAG: protein-glutamate O-methyltransferase CheR, partial [Pseudomonadota bacterium]
ACCPCAWRRGQPSKSLWLWSAGCATGEEPYSLGVTLLTMMPDAASHDIKILATDIDRNALAKARAGCYPSRALGEEVSAEQREKFFTDSPDNTVTVSEGLRKLISFKEMNFARSWPVKGPFDIVFCRNVVIYFEEDMIAKIWNGFANVMPDGARLYIGHSERMVGKATELFKSSGTTTYTKVSPDT